MNCLPVERPENLHNSVLAAVLAVTRKLNSKWCIGIIIPVKCQPLPPGSIRTTVLEFRGEFLDPNKVLIRILILIMKLVWLRPEEIIDKLPPCIGQGSRFHQFCYIETLWDNDWGRPMVADGVAHQGWSHICCAIVVSVEYTRNALVCWGGNPLHILSILFVSSVLSSESEW